VASLDQPVADFDSFALPSAVHQMLALHLAAVHQMLALHLAAVHDSLPWTDRSFDYGSSPQQ
jgi:hypothetical protein